MTYSEYRHSYATAKEFRKAFGNLPEGEARALISTIKGSTAIKACMTSTWLFAQEEGEDNNTDASKKGNCDEL